MKYQITASIVAYQSEPLEIIEAARSFLQSSIKDSLLIIIDHSANDSLRVHFEISEHVQYFHHPENRGFGAGHNIAIRKIWNDSPFHLILNPDVSFEQVVLSTLVEYMQVNPATALVMPKIVDNKGNLQYLAKLIPHPADLLFKRFLPKAIANSRLQKFQLKFTDYQQPMNVPYLSGCFMLLRTAALHTVGLFDERFFMYPEDMDLTRRLHDQYDTMYYPYVQIVHRHEASSYKSFKMFTIHLFNLVKYFNKWGWFFDSKRKRINTKVLETLRYKG